MDTTTKITDATTGGWIAETPTKFPSKEDLAAIGVEYTEEPIDAVAEHVKGTFNLNDIIEAARATADIQPAVDIFKYTNEGVFERLPDATVEAVVDNVLDQSSGYEFPTPTLDSLKQEIEGLKGFQHIDAVITRVVRLEEFNKKLLVALKQHGFDTNKLFR